MQCLHYLVASCGGLVALFLRAVSATHSIPSSTPSPVSPLVARVISSRVFSSCHPGISNINYGINIAFSKYLEDTQEVSLFIIKL